MQRLHKNGTSKIIVNIPDGDTSFVNGKKQSVNAPDKHR